MIEILASSQTFFLGDWFVIGIIGGILWAFKDNFNFGPNNDDDENLYY
jgi:hypothetical protein